jgi:hypothetical protein
LTCKFDRPRMMKLGSKSNLRLPCGP